MKCLCLLVVFTLGVQAIAAPPTVAEERTPAPAAKATPTPTPGPGSIPVLDPDWAVSFFANMAAAVTAFVTLRGLPGNFTKAKEALADLKLFKTNRMAYKAAIVEAEKFAKKKEGLVTELEENFNQYGPALELLDKKIQSVLGPEALDFKGKGGQIDADLQQLLTFPGAKGDADLEEALEHWTKRRAGDRLEAWIDAKLAGGDFFGPAERMEWLRSYVLHQQQRAALYWKEKNSTVEVEKWIEKNKGRTQVLTEDQTKWIGKVDGLKKEEAEAAETFLRQFAVFTAELNADIKDPKNQFSVLLTWTKREPGQFMTQDEGNGKPMHASKVMDYAKGRCTKGYQGLMDVVKAAAAKGSYWALGGLGLAVVTPVATGLAGAGGAYVAIRGFYRMFFPPPKKDEKKDAKPGEKKDDKKDEKKDDKKKVGLRLSPTQRFEPFADRGQRGLTFA